jgi:hypothetical protein
LAWFLLWWRRCQAKSFFYFVVAYDFDFARMKSVKHKPRFQIKWNTGERIEKPVKGKGSFTRKEKHKKKIDPDNQN